MPSNYPQHKWNQYIDGRFSYSNQVNNSNISVLDDVNCNQLSLEPRLQEYIKKKKLYRDNNVEADVPLEKTYQITKDDIKIITAFFSGRRDMYDQDNAEFNELVRKKHHKKQYFESKSFRKSDPKLVQAKNKLASHYAQNHGMFVPDSGDAYYDGYPDQSQMPLDARDFSQTFGNDTRNKHILSNLSYSDNAPCNPTGNPMGNSTFNSNYSTFDSQNTRNTDTHFNSETKRNSKKGLSTLDYRFAPVQSDTFGGPYGTDNTSNNVDCETELLCGTPLYTQKSYGYRNPQEHFFDYIDPELQMASTGLDDYMERGGISTRGSNKGTAKNYRNII